MFIKDVNHDGIFSGWLALRGPFVDKSIIGISTRERSQISMLDISFLPLKCLLPLLCFLLTVMFFAELGLLCGEVGLSGLWIVSGCNSRDFLLKRKSRSLPTEFMGDETGEFWGVADMHGSFPFFQGKFFMGDGEDDGIYVI